MWFKHRMSIAQQLIPIYNTTLCIRTKIYVVRNVVNCLCHKLNDTNRPRGRMSYVSLVVIFSITYNATLTCLSHKTTSIFFLNITTQETCQQTGLSQKSVVTQETYQTLAPAVQTGIGGLCSPARPHSWPAVPPFPHTSVSSRARAEWCAAIDDLETETARKTRYMPGDTIHNLLVTQISQLKDFFQFLTINQIVLFKYDFQLSLKVSDFFPLYSDLQMPFID